MNQRQDIISISDLPVERKCEAFARFFAFVAVALLGLALFGAGGAMADCQVTDTTADGGQVVTCTDVDPDGYDGTTNGDEVTILPGATVNGGDGIETDLGADTITMLGGTVDVTDDGLSGDGDDDVITFVDGVIMALGNGIQGRDGNDTIRVEGGSITANDNPINGGNGADVIIITGGTITEVVEGPTGAVNGEGGGDLIMVSGGTITGANETLKGGDGNDTIVVTGGNLIALDEEVIDADDGDDGITVSNTTLTVTDLGRAVVAADSGNDIVTLGDGLVFNSRFDGGDGFDQLVFAMTVPVEDVAALTAALAAANPGADSLDINGTTYTWEDFEELIANFQVQSLAIPSLSHVGLGLLTSLLAVASILVMRRRL